ncbi:immunity 22 family protein [Bacillus wiedmannii]|uniref:immunity 22 family protein n=1 Tax=Bacillus wiedmannii TaxID=1890302 RepID=UPI001155BED1|nr:immunity 22 family protein [Bacillus wiedmannii]
MNYRPARWGGKVEYSGMASVWFGISKSLQNLEEYVDIDYTIDGDSVHSKFGMSFEFGYYDEDNIEFYFYENNKRDVEHILSDFSYSERITPKIKKLINGDSLANDINFVIVLYDFKYNEAKREDMFDGLEVTFIGSMPYR